MGKRKGNIVQTLTSKKVKTIILSVVIAIVLSGFVFVFIESIYPRPQFEDYCNGIKGGPRFVGEKGIPGEINQTNCEEDNGTWIYGGCDYNYECRIEYDKVNDKHNFVVFVVAAITGLIAISVGIMLALPSVSSGLMLGGTFLMFFGTARYWDNLNNWIRTLILGVVLIVLIWLGYKKLEG